MKANDLKELKLLKIEELKTRVVKGREELSGLILDRNMKKLKDIKSVTKKKKELAQVLTILKQKELLEQLESRVKSQESSAVDTKEEVKKEGVKERKESKSRKK